MREAEEWIAADPALQARFDAAAERYAADRDRLVTADAPSFGPTGGVGGASGGVKCLHAHYADFAAGNDNPVGERTGLAVEPLDCVVPCVADVENGPARNPEWREPKRSPP